MKIRHQINRYPGFENVSSSEFELDEDLYLKLKKFCKKESLSSIQNEISYLLQSFSEQFATTNSLEVFITSPEIKQRKDYIKNFATGVNELVFYFNNGARMAIKNSKFFDEIIGKLSQDAELMDVIAYQKLMVEISDLGGGGAKASKKIKSRSLRLSQLLARGSSLKLIMLIRFHDPNVKYSNDEIYRITYDLLLYAGFFTGREKSPEASMKKLLKLYPSKKNA